jgi:hypothetical protein
MEEDTSSAGSIVQDQILCREIGHSTLDCHKMSTCKYSRNTYIFKRTTGWSTKENLPAEIARILKFGNAGKRKCVLASTGGNNSLQRFVTPRLATLRRCKGNTRTARPSLPTSETSPRFHGPEQVTRALLVRLHINACQNVGVGSVDP